MEDLYNDRRHRPHKRNVGGGGGVGCSPGMVALASFSILGLISGLVASSVVFATSIASLQTQINNMNALAPNMTVYPTPCYGSSNQPIVPTQMECVGDGITTPAQNCDLVYRTTDGETNGPGLCGGIFVTRMGHNMTVTVGVGGSVYYANNTANTNNPYNPAGPFVSVTTKIRWNNMIPVGLRPLTNISITAVYEYGLPQTMIATIGQIFFNTDGSIELGVGFGDTIPGPEVSHTGFNVAVSYITYTLNT